MEELWTPDAREKGRLEKPKNWKMEERNNWKMEEFCDIYIYLLEIRVSWAAGKSDRLTDYLTDDLSTLSSRYICHNSSILPFFPHMSDLKKSSIFLPCRVFTSVKSRFALSYSWYMTCIIQCHGWNSSAENFMPQEQLQKGIQEWILVGALFPQE